MPTITSSPEIIDAFHGQYRWLSNFWPATVYIGTDIYPTVEHAYQAAKAESPLEQQSIRLAATPGDAKRLGRKVKKRNNWEEIKIQVMLSLLERKFEDPVLAQKLIDTGDAILIEGNTWNDTFWGVCNGVGENWLGKLLMHIRAHLKQKLETQE